MVGGPILMGVIGRPHGVRGLVRVHSYTADPADLARYPLRDERGAAWSLAWRGDGVAELRDGSGCAVAGRNAAQTMTNRRLYASRDALPPTGPDEFYLADLVGLSAFDTAGRPIGEVGAVHDHGAGLYLELGETLIPFTRAAVPMVDLAARRITVDLPAEIEAP